jgi:hypothetical protein
MAVCAWSVGQKEQGIRLLVEDTWSSGADTFSVKILYVDITYLALNISPAGVSPLLGNS